MGTDVFGGADKMEEIEITKNENLEGDLTGINVDVHLLSRKIITVN